MGVYVQRPMVVAVCCEGYAALDRGENPHDRLLLSPGDWLVSDGGYLGRVGPEEFAARFSPWSSGGGAEEERLRGLLAEACGGD